MILLLLSILTISTPTYGCTAEQKSLACELFNSANVKASQAHQSRVIDNAFAYNNLRDMCNGLQASRSSYLCPGGCNAPGGSTCLSTNLLKYLVALKNQGKVTINELAGACHSCKSKHYSGLAVDLSIRDKRNSDYLSTCKAMRGKGLDEKDHIHCEFSDGPHPNW